MLSQTAIKAAANELLGRATGLKVYGREVTEGCERPSLFVEIISKPSKGKTRNFEKSGFTLKITLLQETPDELQQLQFVDKVKAAFGMVFAVQDRRLTVGEIEYDYTGKTREILQVSVDFEFYENTTMEPEEETAREMEFNLLKNGGEQYGRN